MRKALITLCVRDFITLWADYYIMNFYYIEIITLWAVMSRYYIMSLYYIISCNNVFWFSIDLLPRYYYYIIIIFLSVMYNIHI